MKQKPEKSARRYRPALIAVAVVLLAAAAVLLFRGRDSGEGESAQTTPAPSETVTTAPDVELSAAPTDAGVSASVQNVTTDAAGEDAPWTTLTDPDYSVTVQSLGGYDGLFIEDGTDDAVTGVLAMLFTNNGSEVIQYAEYAFRAGEETLSFKLSDLPAGSSAVVLEANRHTYDENEALTLVDRLVATVPELTFASEQVLVVDNGDGSLTLVNQTDAVLPVVRVFYKGYYAEEDVFVGGITYTAKGRDVPVGGSVTITPSHYVPDDCILLGSAVYDE